MSNNKNENLVKTSTGTLQGFCSDKGIGTFLGVPFAQPPIGPLRWCNALPLDETQELHDCTSFAPDPIQQNHDEASIMSQFHHSTNDGNQTSEDCLYLNIWSPKIPNEKHNDRAKLGLPVIVFLCGGGHRFGSASADVSHGEALAKRGAVVVTVPYRVGALGYLAHSDLRGPNGGSGNWALSDIITALEWVRNEISAFGGDCDCVTIMGQSAGAAHVSALMAAPRAKKLFLRAVALSGGRFNGGPLGKIDQLEVAEEKGKKIVNEFPTTSALYLRDMPADTLKNISAPWNLVIDGQLLPETPDQAFAARRQPKVPLLLSFTQDDAAPFPDKNMQTIAGFKAALKAEFPDNVASSIAACYDLSSEKAAKKSAYDFVRDTRFAYQVTQFARIHRANGGSLTWMSHFKHAPKWPKDKKFSQPRPPEGYGAYHGAELWYFFDNLDRAPFPVDNEDRTLANEMASSLVTFARSGDPNYAEPGAWPPFGYGNLPRLARHFGGTGSDPFRGQVKISNNRITAVAPSSNEISTDGSTVIDGQGLMMMPGMTEAHAHLSFGSTIDAITTNRDMGYEERLMRTVNAAKTYIDYGWTSAYSAGAHSTEGEVALRDAIADNRMIGPRMRACSFEKSSSLLADFDNRYAGIGARPPDVEGTRNFVNEMADLGVDSVKFVVTGESAIKVGTSQVLQFYPEELAAAQEVANERGIWLNTHCHSAESVHMALDYGFRVLYHCTWTDERGMDMMEASRDEIFVAPAPGVNYAACYEGEKYGITKEKAEEQEQFLNLEKVSALMPQLKKRGVRVLPGGDYGFPFNPIGKNARDLELFVTHFGFTPQEALRSATQYGGQIMGMENELGLIRVGYLADILLVAGDPIKNIKALQDVNNIRFVMQDGKVKKSLLAPPWTSGSANQVAPQ